MTSFDLSLIRTASPCSARWEQMVGSDVSRYCDLCSKCIGSPFNGNLNSAFSVRIPRPG